MFTFKLFRIKHFFMNFFTMPMVTFVVKYKGWHHKHLKSTIRLNLFILFLHIFNSSNKLKNLFILELYLLFTNVLKNDYINYIDVKFNIKFKNDPSI